MEFEPRLAAQLDRHWDSLEGKVAILTLWINDSGESGVVRAEILQKFTPKLKPGYGPGQADIDYDVLFVSPEGSKPAKAEDGDWQQVGRLNQLYQHHKHLVAAYRRKLQTADMMSLSSTMNNMYAGMMKGMAADAAAQRAPAAVNQRPLNRGPGFVTRNRTAGQRTLTKNRCSPH